MNAFGRYSKTPLWLTAATLVTILTGCGGDSSSSDSKPSTEPGNALTVSATGPASNAAGVALNSKVIAEFSDTIDPATIDTTTFTVAAAGQSQSVGTVTVDAASNTASFVGTSDFGAATVYTATISSAVKSLTGNTLASDYAWTFTTGDSADSTPPTVSATTPLNGDVAVAPNRSITTTFSEPMDPSTFSATSFTLTGPGTTAVSGTVDYLGTTASFTPMSTLAAATLYTATVTTGAADLAGNTLAANTIWTFTTGETVAEGPAPVILGTAANYVILSKAGISTTGTTAITGDIGVSPAAESFITGFSQARDASDEFATSATVTGEIFAADMAPPTPSIMTTAISDMEIAYTDAAGRTTPDYTELGAGDISGRTLTPGLYKWGTGLLLATDVTLNGDANDVWILQIAQDLTVSNGVAVNLTGGALAKNVFWQVAGAVTLGTTSDFKGVILSKTNIVMQNGADLNGRALAQTAVTLDANAVTAPAL